MRVTARVAGLLPLLLLSRPAPAQLAHAEPEWYLRPADGCRLFVQEYGRGPDTVVVLHGGWGAEHGYLLDAFVGLEDRYHLVFYDQRGSLRSPCADSAISVEAHVADLERLRLQLGLERMTLFGHSMGTMLAMLYLDRHPERVRGLVLAAPVLPRRPRGEAEQELARRIGEADRAFRERPEVAAELREHGLDRDPEALSDEERTRHWRIRFAGEGTYSIDHWPRMKGGMAFYNASAGRAAAATMPEDYDFTGALSAHPCPVWIVMGAYDVGRPDLAREAFRTWFDPVRGVRTTLIDRAAHNLWIDQPEAFRRFLGEALPSTTSCQAGR